MNGNAMQNYLLHAYFRNDRYRQNEWEDLQKNDQRLITAYRIDKELIGMTAFQMISYSAYLIFKADYNNPAREALDQVRGQGYYDSHITADHLQDENGNDLEWVNYNFSLDLEDWNIVKPHLLYVSKVF